jgi:hypothetical protein
VRVRVSPGARPHSIMASALSLYLRDSRSTRDGGSEGRMRYVVPQFQEESQPQEADPGGGECGDGTEAAGGGSPVRETAQAALRAAWHVLWMIVMIAIILGGIILLLAMLHDTGR